MRAVARYLIPLAVLAPLAAAGCQQAPPPEGRPLVVASFYPMYEFARQVAGDLYDFLRAAGGKLAFFAGDVSGKGMPAALFMVAVRTLSRHLATSGDNPAITLGRLNSAEGVRTFNHYESQTPSS